MVGRWLTHFPNAYFGFTAAVTSLSDEQIEGLRSIPEDKLLLETDSPYTRRHKHPGILRGCGQ